MNKNTFNKVNEIEKNLTNFLLELEKLYDIERSDYISLIFGEKVRFEEKQIDEIINFDKPLEIPFVILKSRCDTDTLDNKSGIITKINSTIHIPIEILYETIIDYNMNDDKILQSLKFTIRHNFGHVLHFRKDFIGKPYEDWVGFCKINKEIFDKFYFRIEHRFENEYRCNRIYNNFMHQYLERNANIMADISTKSIIDQFDLMHTK